MKAPIAELRCRACGGPTRTDPTTSKHVCTFCGATLFVSATGDAMREIGQRFIKALAPFEAELEKLQAAIDRATQAQNEDELRALVRKRWEIWRPAYQSSGQFRLAGLDTAEQVEAALPQWIDSEVRGLLGRPLDNPEYLDAIKRKDVDALVAAYRNFDHHSRDDLRPPHEIEASIQSGLEMVLRMFDWVSAEDLRRHGFRVSELRVDDQGNQHLRCGACDGDILLETVSEVIICQFCQAECRPRLDAYDRMVLAGYFDDLSPEDAALQKDMMLASLRQDQNAVVRWLLQQYGEVALPTQDKLTMMLDTATSIFPWVDRDLLGARLREANDR